MSSDKIRISQSLLKALFDVVDKKGEECGLVVKAKFIDGRFDEFKSTTSNEYGIWFEYNITGALPKSGSVPSPKKEGDVYTQKQYRSLSKHIKNFKNLLFTYGIEVLETNVKFEVDELVGTFDAICLAKKDIYNDKGMLIVQKGQKFIADFKVSGLLDDKWNKFGWNLDFLSNKMSLVTQPVHYKLMWKLKYGEEAPFLFFLFNVDDENDFRVIDFRCDETHYEDHKQFIVKMVGWLNHFMKEGFPARPSPEKCAVCPIRAGCEHFAVVPKIKTFYLNSGVIE